MTRVSLLIHIYILEGHVYTSYKVYTWPSKFEICRREETNLQHFVENKPL